MMAVKIGMKPVHPGKIIKRYILPDDLSVIAAAKVLGVGPLSNQLSGKAQPSPGMALNVEKAWRGFIDYRNGVAIWVGLSDKARARFRTSTEQIINTFVSTLADPTTLANSA